MVAFLGFLGIGQKSMALAAEAEKVVSHPEPELTAEQLNPQHLNPMDLYQDARKSNISYLDTQQIVSENATHVTGLTQTVVLEKEGMRANVSFDPVYDTVAVVFRGSDDSNWENIKGAANANLNTAHASHPIAKDASVQEGFQEALGDVNDPNSLMFQTLQEVQKKQEQVVASGGEAPSVDLYGHSLGGGMAQLAALEMSQKGLQIHKVSTFGAPPVGNAQFVEAYNAQLGMQTSTVQDRHDIVALSEIKSLGDSDPLVHAGNVIELDSDKSQLIDRYAYRNEKKTNAISSEQWKGAGLDAHSLDSYEDALLKVAKTPAYVQKWMEATVGDDIVNLGMFACREQDAGESVSVMCNAAEKTAPSQGKGA